MFVVLEGVGSGWSSGVVGFRCCNKGQTDCMYVCMSFMMYYSVYNGMME